MSDEPTLANDEEALADRLARIIKEVGQVDRERADWKRWCKDREARIGELQEAIGSVADRAATLERERDEARCIATDLAGRAHGTTLTTLTERETIESWREDQR